MLPRGATSGLVYASHIAPRDEPAATPASRAPGAPPLLVLLVLVLLVLLLVVVLLLLLRGRLTCSWESKSAALLSRSTALSLREGLRAAGPSAAAASTSAAFAFAFATASTVACAFTVASSSAARRQRCGCRRLGSRAL